ncbi:RNA-directed DNA polymerase, eukaryota, reverse transcriptase zinc-binding domain protein [Tanacetum coccineum]
MSRIGPSLEHLAKLKSESNEWPLFSLSDVTPPKSGRSGKIDHFVDIIAQLKRSKTYQLLSNAIQSQDNEVATPLDAAAGLGKGEAMWPFIFLVPTRLSCCWVSCFKGSRRFDKGFHKFSHLYFVYIDHGWLENVIKDADNFNSFIDNSGLIDLPLGGRLFTWINKAGTKLSKLDRFLISKEVAKALPDVCVTAIDHLWSDHNLILLHVSKSDFEPTHFKLFHSWILCDSFDEVIKTMLPKLEEHNFGRKLLSHEKFHILKARVKQWLTETKTFDGVTKHDNLQLGEKFKDHDSNMDFPSVTNSSGLCVVDRDSLETPVSLEEVKNTVWDCGSSKAPEPDGACLSLSRDSVLVNGSPTSKFSIKCGLKQVDPLLPFLFILVMEGLHNALSIVVISGLIRGIKFGDPEVTISHLFYVDDVLITTEWNANDLDNINRGRYTLIKAVLGSLDIYYFSIFKVLEYVIISLERSRAMLFREVVLKILTLPFSKSSVGGCYRTRTRSRLKLSKLYMARKVALITMVASIMVVKEKSRRLSVIFSSSLWWLWEYRNSVTLHSHLMRKSGIFDNIRLSSYSSALLVAWNGYLRKGRKTKPKRQNRTRNGKAGKDKVKIQAQV